MATVFWRLSLRKTIGLVYRGRSLGLASGRNQTKLPPDYMAALLASQSGRRELIKGADCGEAPLPSWPVDWDSAWMITIEAFLPRSATRVVVYLQPINVRRGVKKLGTFCREVVGVEPDECTCFLFVNGRRDTLLMYFLSTDGEQILVKKLEKGSFLLPAPDANGAPVAVLRRSMLPRLFRS
jgi:hypothetical protein